MEKPIITTRYNISDILKYPDKFIDEYSDTEILTLPDCEAAGGILRILVGVDKDGRYYLVLEDDDTAEDVYPKDEETIMETFVRILDENISREPRGSIAEVLHRLCNEYSRLDIECTCSACPEQYEVWDSEDEDYPQIGYLRLRGGQFTAECPDARGELVYKAFPNGHHFFEDEEREKYLREAVAAVIEWKKIRDEVTQKIRAYIIADDHRLEDYSDVEIYSDLDFEIALSRMESKLEEATNETLVEFAQAIDSNTVSYEKHGCR